MTRQRGGSGYVSAFKNTLSPCYENVEKAGWHGGRKRVRRTRHRGGGNIPTCQSTVPSWHNAGVNPSSSNAIALGAKINEYQFTRTLPDGNLYTAGQLSFTDSCAPRYPDFVPKVGGAKKKSMLNKVRNTTKKAVNKMKNGSKKVVNKMKKGSKKIMGKMQGLLKRTKHKGNLTMTVGKDGKKYFFKKGKRVKNPTHAHVHKKHH